MDLYQVVVSIWRSRSAAAVREAPISGLVLQIAIPPSSHRIDSLWVGFLNSRSGARFLAHARDVRTVLSGGDSALVICTIPLDTAKVRLQLQKKVVALDAMTLPKYKGLLGTVGTIAREEGMASLWKGIVPGLHRQFLFGGLRIGLYEPLKTSTWGKNHVGDVSLSKKIFAALTTGALGIAIANPTDLVKVRLQAEGKLPQGVPRRYSGALNAYSTIVRQEGVAKLWTGLGPNVARNAIINAAELASYDQVKEVLQHLLSFLFSYHLLSLISFGFFFF
ncbi:hypothetical protein ACS0TY_030034 [Phlomoides rotata]